MAFNFFFYLASFLSAIGSIRVRVGGYVVGVLGLDWGMRLVCGGVKID